MSTASAYLTIRGLDVHVIYKDIKHLHIGVYPPLGRVRVAAPSRLGDEQVRLAVVKRWSWIIRQRERLQSAQRQSRREMVTGESHYIWGVRHRLRVIERPGRSHIEIDGERILLYAPPDTDANTRRKVFDSWRREQLRQRVPILIDAWEPRVGRSVKRWSVRRMKTKWGSCNAETAHICLNLELAAKHPDLLEYIVVHEMTHLLERGHGERFTRLMDQFMPNWQARRAALNTAPLAHEEWASWSHS